MEKDKLIEELLIRFSLFPDDEGEKKDMYDIVNKYIPEGSVVLTKEEYEKLKNKPPFAIIKFDEEKMKETAKNFVLEFTKKGKDKIRKEKAREILEKVGNIEDCGGVLLKQYKWFVDLCKENGVDVE